MGRGSGEGTVEEGITGTTIKTQGENQGGGGRVRLWWHGGMGRKGIQL